MNSDGYVFFTESHRLYVQGVRRTLRERLTSAFGEDWWEKGVEHALPADRRKALHIELEKNPDRDRHLLLDAGHFGPIIAKHHNEAFSDAFNDSIRTFKEFRQLTSIRNEWAHVQGISLARARQAAELMKHILASLRCEEALEIEQMIRDFHFDPGSGTTGDSIDDLGHEDDSFDTHQSAMAPLEFWRQVQSYLVLEKSVELPDDESSPARVMIRVHNTAPDSSDWPTVYFKSVVMRSLERDYWSEQLGELAPGETREVEFLCPKRRLMDIEFEVFGEIDADKLFEFRRTTTLPAEIVAPLQLEFVNDLESIGIKDFVNGVLDEIGSPDPNMRMADIARVREALRRQPDRIREKRTALDELWRKFHLNGASMLGSRTVEIIVALDDFGKKLTVLDDAIGHTDLKLMSEAAHDLKQVQLAVLRVEDAIRTMTTSG